MINSEDSFLHHWVSTHYAWELGTAVKLLLGKDPKHHSGKVGLSGNDDLTRVYVWAVKQIKEGKLTAINEAPLDDGTTEYTVQRDEFIKWAKDNNYKDDWIAPLHETWKSYKASKGNSTTEREKKTQAWQQWLDAQYVKIYQGKLKPQTHTQLCKELAKRDYPGEKGASERIRRYTKHRKRDWILGKHEII